MTDRTAAPGFWDMQPPPVVPDFGPDEPPSLLDRARMVRRYTLAPDGHRFELEAASREAEEDPAAFALAVLLDVPRRVHRFLARPVPTYLAVLLVALAGRVA